MAAMTIGDPITKNKQTRKKKLKLWAGKMAQWVLDGLSRYPGSTW